MTPSPMRDPCRDSSSATETTLVVLREMNAMLDKPDGINSRLDHVVRLRAGVQTPCPLSS